MKKTQTKFQKTIELANLALEIAKENLYIMQPTSDYYYTIGGPIV